MMHWWWTASCRVVSRRSGQWLIIWARLRACLVLPGTVWTASAHIITAVIGSGVLSLGWAIAQLGWVAGPAVMLLFSFVTYYTSALLADCYRSGDPCTGKRNYTYMDAVNANLSTCSARAFDSFSWLAVCRC